LDCERVLAIGRTSRPVEELGTMGRPAQISLLEYHEFLIQSEAPQADIVLSPMVGDTFDCLDVAVHLHASGFRGRLHVMAPALPDPAILRREVASICPGIEVDVVIRGATGLISQTGPRPT
jgi:hypothetical protein